jgi:sulfatase modifying factor 1
MTTRALGLGIAVAALVASVAPVGPAAAGGRAGRLVRVERPESARVEVPAGRFIMGTPLEDLEVLLDECRRVESLSSNGLDVCAAWFAAMAERTPRDVWLDRFAIDRFEVTVEAYRACVHAGACPIAALLEGDPRHLGPGQPMVNVTRGEAAGFCAWRGGRLPTEAEWEKAARGTDGRTWPWGDRGGPGRFNHGEPRAAVLVELEGLMEPAQRPERQVGDPDDRDGWATAAPPGSLRAGDGPYGTADQAGNVAEWVLDSFSLRGLLGQPGRNPVRDPDPSGDAGHVRGGSWRDPPFAGRVDLPHYLSAIIRPEARLPYVGFRCVYGAVAPTPWAAVPVDRR